MIATQDAMDVTKDGLQKIEMVVAERMQQLKKAQDDLQLAQVQLAAAKKEAEILAVQLHVEREVKPTVFGVFLTPSALGEEDNASRSRSDTWRARRHPR